MTGQVQFCRNSPPCFKTISPHQELPHRYHVNTMPDIESVGGADALAFQPSVKPIELSLPLPKAPETQIHIHLTINTTSLLLFLTTIYGGETGTGVPLGSFVYALPDVSSRADSHIEYVGVLTTTEDQPRADYLYTPLHTRIVSRIHNPSREIVSTKDCKACLCGKFDELCACGYGRHSRRGN
jgi:hypothetical protein